MEFYDYVNNDENDDRCYYVNNDRFYFSFVKKSDSGDFIINQIYFICNNLFESGQINRPIVLDFLKTLIRREKINKILKRCEKKDVKKLN